MCKRLLASVLACLMISLAACGKQPAKNKGTGHIKDGFVFEGNSSTEKTVDLGMPDAELNPQKVYSSITYFPEMFYGDYSIRGGDKAQDKFGEESNYFKCLRNGEEAEYTTLPFRIQAGKETMMHSINYVEDHNWMQLFFMRKYNNNQRALDTVICAYTIEGNKLILKPLETFEVDKENKKITYTFSDLVWEYTFAFSGRNLTLTSGADSVTLTTGLDAYHEVDYFGVNHYLSAGSKSMANIDKINFLYASEDNASKLYFELTDGTASYNSIAVLQENGLFTFTLALKESTKTYQYVCFYGGRDGVVFTDGNEIYFYNDTYSDHHKNNVSKYLTEDQTSKLDELTDSQLEAIVEKTENLLEDLAEAYQRAGLNVAVNTQTGEIALDSTVLFGVDESDVSAEGKEFLKKFIQVYTSVVFSDKYENFVSTIMVEGHTDTSGSYELNQALSQARANSVKDYCLSADCGVEQIYASALQEMLQAVGYSYDKPIYDENGEVDMDASRRVSFRFIVNLDQ